MGTPESIRGGPFPVSNLRHDLRGNVALRGLSEALEASPRYREVRDRIIVGEVPVATVIEAAKPYVIATLWRDLQRPLVLVCPHPDDARRMVEQLMAYAGEDAAVLHFAESEVLPYERLSVEAGTVHERLSALGALHAFHAPPSNPHHPRPSPPLIVTSVTALMQKTLGPEIISTLTHTIRRDEKLSIDATMLGWAKMGYHVSQLVEEPGTAARRGGILDIYPPGQPMPARIDLWGDRVDTLRYFETGSQRSTVSLDQITVLPASEVLPALADHEAIDRMVRGLDFSNCRTAERNRVNDELAELMSGLSFDNASLYTGFLLQHSLLDHLALFPEAVLAFNEPSEATEAAQHVEAGAEKMRLSKQERGELPLGFPSALVPWSEVAGRIAAYGRRFELSRYHRAEADGIAVALPFAVSPGYHGSMDGLVETLRESRRAPVVIATQHSRRLQEILGEASVGTREAQSLDKLAGDHVVDIVHATVAGGWSLRESDDNGKDKLVLLTDNEVFGTSKRRLTRPKRHAARFRATTPEELTPGQFVVHIDHGIAKFIGTSADAGGGPLMDSDGAQREYLVLEYAESDRLYVPMEHLDRISAYVGGNDVTPSPTRLGTQEWTRAVSRARESTKKLAVDLLALYAQREMAEGFAHTEDTPWQREMEDAFPFVETPDQDLAIAQVKEDLELAKPMDRLVCGDVGYGKTEVALRAAFKTVMSGKQVAVLVPTTILAQQHYTTFTDRLAPFPVKVEMLSRFRSNREQDEIIAKLKRGDVDVVIGTHRLVQKDVGFKDLGLVVIDEEHRFGVGHKERMKELRREVDVLTLTATPIPRTLHMALAGIRDISTIETPPEERLPIKTYLAEASDDLVREAITRELDRGGQVFYLHNRVKTINLAAGKLRELVPNARVMVGHGQMPEDELSDVMTKFADGDADVLVCTTIIESGLDIPAVNTIVIDRADRLGLAQLYQLRGRIGRRSQRAYAYLLVERGRRLTDLAQRRLQTIIAATELGAGFRIAMKDLEIRGAGNILGAEQSGQIHAIGFDLYTRLLAEAVTEMRAATGMGRAQDPEGPDPIIDLGLPAHIPEDLVPHMPTRMSLYQRLAKARTLEEVDGLPQEFRDRFGHQLPDELSHLLYGVRVKVLARAAQIASIVKRKDVVTLKLVEQVGGARVPLERALGHGVSVGNQQIHLPAGNTDVPWGQALLEIIAGIKDFQRHVPELAAAAALADAGDKASPEG
jgi:transcription-repair coupling factor (superfamily II helicase)